MDKAHEQAQTTRQQNAAARKARRAAREAQEKADKALVLEALRGVLQEQTATPAERLYAVAVLDSMEHYGFVPYDVKHPGKSNSELVAEFARKMEASGHE